MKKYLLILAVLLSTLAYGQQRPVNPFNTALQVQGFDALKVQKYFNLPPTQTFPSYVQDAVKDGSLSYRPSDKKVMKYNGTTNTWEVYGDAGTIDTTHTSTGVATWNYIQRFLTQANATSTYVKLGGSYADPSWITSLDWAKIINTPTTLAGYGIADAGTITYNDARYLLKFGGNTYFGSQKLWDGSNYGVITHYGTTYGGLWAADVTKNDNTAGLKLSGSYTTLQGAIRADIDINGTNMVSVDATNTYINNQLNLFPVASGTVGDELLVLNGGYMVKKLPGTTYLKSTGGTVTGDIQQTAGPVNASSLITKGYADNLFTGLSWKQEVRVATTANITLSGTQTIDGISLAVNDRVLVKNQTTQTENGIYVVQAGAWVRALDADTDAEIGAATVMVKVGTVNKNTQWTCTNVTYPVIGTDNITFGQISGAGTYTNGTGISLTGNVFSLNLTYADARYLNQNTTGSAATLTTTRTIWGQNFNGSANVSGALSGATTIAASSSVTAPQIIASGNQSSSAGAWGTGGLQLKVNGAVLTNTSTAASGTVAFLAANAIGASAFVSTNTGVTVTRAATFYISGPAGASTNTTITNAYSLYINSGISYLGGVAVVGSSDIRMPGVTGAMQVFGGLISDDISSINLSTTAGTGSFLNFHSGNPSISSTLSRIGTSLGASGESNFVFYGYNGGGYQTMMWLDGSGSSSVRFGSGITNHTGDGSGAIIQAQGGIGLSYAGSLTAQGGDGVGIGGNETTHQGEIKAYNSVSGTILPLRIDATITTLTGNLGAVVPTYSSGTRVPVVYNSTNGRFETEAGGSYVDLTTNQTIAGNKTFTGTMSFANGITTVGVLGLGNGAVSISGSTSGSADFSFDFRGGGHRRILIYCNALVGTATYGFPETWSHTPAIIATDQVSAAVVTAISTTSVTITGATTTGFIILEGY